MLRPLAYMMRQNRHIGLLLLRLFIGLRLVSGALRTFIISERLDRFAELLAQQGVPNPVLIVSIIAALQLTIGILLILGYRTRWAAASSLLILAFLVIVFKFDNLFLSTMPPVLSLGLAVVLLFTSPGLFSIQHLDKLKSLARRQSDI